MYTPKHCSNVYNYPLNREVYSLTKQISIFLLQKHILFWLVCKYMQNLLHVDNSTLPCYMYIIRHYMFAKAVKEVAFQLHYVVDRT